MREIFFLHIPKCAGLSVKAATGDKIISHGHWTPQEYVQQYGKRFVCGYKLAIVRHPCARFVSAYNYLVQQTPAHKFWHDDTAQRAFLSQYQSIEQVAACGNKRLLDYLLFIPQVRWLQHCQVDRIIRFEQLAAEWPHMQSQFGFAALPHINASNHAPWQQTLSAAAAAQLKDWYSNDFNWLGYLPTEE